MTGQLTEQSQGCIDDFIMGEGDTILPPDTPHLHGELLCALRHVNIEGKKDRNALSEKIGEVTELLLGKLPDRSDGLVEEVKTNTRFRKAASWVFGAFSLAFLGGFGAWAWSMVVS